MKIAIIGCGITGLASMRKVLEYDLECVAFERNDDIGGLWRYDDRTGIDELNNPISGCYESLRAHLPHFLMKYTRFKHSSTDDFNFPHHTDIMEYLNDFVNEYNLKSYIKFNHRVQKISRNKETWTLIVENLSENLIEMYEFDGVMICSGHYWEPRLPLLAGSDTFSGHQIHSNRYRRNISYTDKRLLVIGAGKSGLEISHECLTVAKEVILSQGTSHYIADLNPKIRLKPRTNAICGQFIYFEDNSSVEVDAIIYCTGYKYYFPFLDSTCGIEIDNNYIVKPLYKKFINIRHPTMCFIGLLKYTPLFWLADFQAEAYVKYLIGRLQLPTIDKMLVSLAEENLAKIEINLPKKFYYLQTGSTVWEYFEDLRKFANLESIPTVYFRINNYLSGLLCDRFASIKKLKFNIVDDQTFTVSECREE